MKVKKTKAKVANAKLNFEKSSTFEEKSVNYTKQAKVMG